MSLPKKNRIVRKKDFDIIFNKGKTVRGSFLFIKQKSNDTDTSRFGFIISKKIVPKATDRNRLKRVFSEILRPRIKDIKPEGSDILVVLRKKDKEELLLKELINILNL